MFQSTPPHGRRLHQLYRGQCHSCFNPRLHMGGDVGFNTLPSVVKGFQSTPPHGRRPGCVATIKSFRPFQSTPPHGRRRIAHEALALFLRFNPRLHMGGDGLRCRPVGSRLVSIHASTWEATRVRDPAGSARISGFQSTPPHGRRPVAKVTGLIGALFQSTPPHGRRRAMFAATRSSSGGFNPRLHMGGDLDAGFFGRQLSFNPRLHMGGDVLKITPSRSSEFQSTPPHGRRPYGVKPIDSAWMFQSTPPHGRRPERSSASNQGDSRFNPRLHMGGDGKVVIPTA